VPIGYIQDGGGGGGGQGQELIPKTMERIFKNLLGLRPEE
jgi:hypothetical protein